MALLPKKLRVGDTIGIVAPSDPVGDTNADFGAGAKQFEAGIRFFEKAGFSIKLAPNLFSASYGYSATPEEKASDINEMFADAEVAAIICAQGGNNANTILPYLDYDCIQKNPKIFLGISDVTVLLNAIYAKTGLITFYGNDIMRGFGRKPDPYDIEEFYTRCVYAKTGLVHKNSLRNILQPGVATGILLGGNLPTLLKSVGTEFQPNFSESILFLEDFGEGSRPTELASGFAQLQQCGIFDHIKGLLVGYYKTSSGISIETVLHHVLGDRYTFPIVQCDDFGHNTPNTTLPVGGFVRLDGDAATLEILRPCVE